MNLFGYWFERRTLIILAVVLIVATGGTFWVLKPSSSSTVTPPPSPTFSSDLKPWSATSLADRKGLYWLGPTLQGTAPYLRRISGQVERGVVFYTALGKPDQVYVIVRTLDSAPFAGGQASGGSALLAKLKRLEKRRELSVPHGRAVLASPTQAIIAPAAGTVVELTLLNSPPGMSLAIRSLARELQPTR